MDKVGFYRQAQIVDLYSWPRPAVPFIPWGKQDQNDQQSGPGRAAQGQTGLIMFKNRGHLTRELKLLIRPLTCAREECFICRDNHSREATEAAAEKNGHWISTDATTLLAQRRMLLLGLVRLVVDYPQTLGQHELAYFNLALEDGFPEADIGCRNSATGHALSTSIGESTGPPSLTNLTIFNFHRPSSLPSSQLMCRGSF